VKRITWGVRECKWGGAQRVGGIETRSKIREEKQKNNAQKNQIKRSELW